MKNVIRVLCVAVAMVAFTRVLPNPNEGEIWYISIVSSRRISIPASIWCNALRRGFQHFRGLGGDQ